MRRATFLSSSLVFALALVGCSSTMDGSPTSDGGVADSNTPFDGGPLVDSSLVIDSDVVIPLDGAIDFALPTVQSNPSTRESVLAIATAEASTPSITLFFAPVADRTVSGIEIFRKTRDATSWGSVFATPDASADRFIDTDVNRGDYFEYKIRMSTSDGMAFGYVAAGIETPPREYNGKIMLLIEERYEARLSSAINTLIADYEGDGWNVIRRTVTESDDVESVHSAIRAAYLADPTNVRAVFLLGHIPIPYSGRLNPDGHEDHLGAWPADGYYGDMDGEWTDTGINLGNNLPGDGRFDQNDYPSLIELEVGRFDMLDMDAFWLRDEEDDGGIYARYLDRLHRYKVRELIPEAHGIVYDNFDTTFNDPGDRFAGSGWRNMSALMGSFNVTQMPNMNEDPDHYTPYFTYLDGESYLWTYACGGGGGTQAAGIGDTWDFASVSTGGFFNMAFGSYFGDFDHDHNNFLRAFVAGGNGLTNVRAGTTHWYFHSMGMGEHIGYGTRHTMNNEQTMLYEPQNGGCCGPGNIYLALLGDPTLRIGMPSPASNFVVSNEGGKVHFTWAPSPEAVNGYLLYEISDDYIRRLNDTPVTDTSFTSTVDYSAGRRFSVRALRLQSNLSGSHYDLSVGRVAVSP